MGEEPGAERQVSDRQPLAASADTAPRAHPAEALAWAKAMGWGAELGEDD